MIVGIIGALLTAAYMARCVYLTFFGEYRGHGHPHESERTITIPLIILAVFSVLAGLLQATPLGIDRFEAWFEPRVAFPSLQHPAFDYPLAAISLVVAVLGLGVGAYFYFRREQLTRFNGLTQRNSLARAGYTFLVNKYYLDDLYENVIVDGTRGAVARASYWVNQHVIDGVVNAVGRGAVKAGRVTYDALDQRLVDGAINGIAIETGMAGGEVRKVQSGRVQRYALILFAGVALLALAIFIINIA
jgi:NADH-quinone oxidoreductase subunit L